MNVADGPAERTCDFSVKPTLTGNRVVLRPFTDDDIPAMRDILRDPAVIRLTGSGPDPAAADPAVAEERLRTWYASRNDQRDRLDLAVVDRSTGTCVGEVVLNDWDEANLACNFRILIGPPGRDRGLGTEAVRLCVAHAFESLGLHRVSLGVFAFNPRARRAYEKVGFVVEGVLRDALRDGDTWVDSTVMSILAHEWAGHRGRPAPLAPEPAS